MALTQTQVSQLYVSIFGRASEGEGNSYWQQDQDSMVAAAAVMLNTEPAKDYFGETLDDNQAFIEHIYLNTLGKTVDDDAEGIGYWVGELEGGKSKADVIVALINAAQDPANAGPAQDQFNNKVLVSNYTADTIAKFTDIATFTAYISGVDDSPESVAAAKGNVDADVPEIIPPVVIGDTIRLTANEDRGEDGTGTADNDTFDGGLGGNIMGQSTNTWQSFDRLDGLGGRDKMDAELIMSVNHFGNPSPLEAKTQNIEEFYINARESGTSTKFSLSLEDINIGGTSVKSLIPKLIPDNILEGIEGVLPGGIFPVGFEMKQASSDVVQVAGREILDWDYIESFYSDADLVVYGLTTNKSNGGTTKLSDMTISMDHTSGSTANTQSLLQDRSFNEWGTEHSQGEYYDHYPEKLGYGHYINGALEASSMKVLFEQNYLTTTTRTEGSALYIELMDMDEALGGGEWKGTGLPLEDNPYGKITFTMNGDVKTLDYGTGSNTYAELLADIQAAITAAAVTDPDFAQLSASFGNRFTATDTDTQPGGSTQGTTIVITNSGSEVLEAKGMFATGEQPAGKDFHTNFYNQKPGTDVLPIIIDIELEKVGRGEDGGGLVVGGDNYTKGFDQFDVYVKGEKNEKVDQSSSVAYLLTTPHDGLDTINIYTHEDYVDNPADLTIGNSNTPVYSILDVNHLDATDFLGNLSIYNAVIQAPGNYLYELSGQDDTLQMYVTNDALNTTNSSLFIDGGAGDNTIHVDYSYSNGSVGVNTDIITESGDDVVVLSNMGLEFEGEGGFGWWPAGSGEDDEDQDGSGDRGDLLIIRADSARIETGAGNDAIFLNSHLDFCSPDAALWHTLNWTGTGAEEMWTSIGQTNLPPWVTEANWAPAGNVFPVFGSSLRVTFAGIESDWVTIDTNKDYKTTKAELVAAMAKAIESDVNLNHVLKVDTDAVTGGISIQSLTGGAFGRGDLFVDVEGPLPYLGDFGFGAGYTPDGGIFDPYFPGTNDVNQISAQQLVAAWNAYYPGSNVKYNAALKTITDMDGTGNGDFTSDDNSNWFDANGDLTVTDLNEFLQAVQQNAETTENMINAALWNQAWPANHQLDNQGSPASAGVQYVNAGSGHDTIVLPSGGITTVEFTGKFDTTTIISDNNIANLRFDFSSYLDSVAAGRGASVNPLLDLNLVNGKTVMDGFCPVPTVALNEFDGVENANDWNVEGGGQHNSITYFNFSDLWDGLEGAYATTAARNAVGADTDLLNNKPEVPPSSFANFDAADLESALNLWLAGGDFGWTGSIRQPEDYFDRNLNQNLGFDNGDSLLDVLGAKFVILVGKDGEVVQNYHDGGADYADPYVNWSIDNGYANGEVKVFTGEIGRTMLAGDQTYTYHFDNVELQGVINLGVADVNNAENRAFNWAENVNVGDLFV